MKSFLAVDSELKSYGNATELTGSTGMRIISCPHGLVSSIYYLVSSIYYQVSSTYYLVSTIYYLVQSEQCGIVKYLSPCLAACPAPSCQLGAASTEIKHWKLSLKFPPLNIHDE